MSNTFQIKRGGPTNLQLKPGELGFHTKKNQLFIGRDNDEPLAIGPTDKTVYATDTNKDGNIELFFGIKPLINFTIEDRYGGVSFDVLNCQAEEGMTWEDWLGSDYNNIPSSDPFYSDSAAGVIINGYNVYNSNWFTVNPSDVIINNSEYYVTA